MGAWDHYKDAISSAEFNIKRANESQIHSARDYYVEQAKVYATLALAHATAAAVRPAE